MGAWGVGGFNDAVQELTFPGQERSHSQTVTEKCVCVWGGGGGGVNDAVQGQEMLTFPGQERGHSQTVTEKCVCVCVEGWGGQ